MRNSGADFNILREWKPGDTREITEAVLKKARLEDRYDSYSQTYQLDGQLWKIREQISKPPGETLYTLVCVGE
jgi:hypothetical protein